MVLSRMAALDMNLHTLIVELTNACHVKCIWCLMQSFNKLKTEHMPYEKFKQFIETNLDYLHARRTQITPYHRGEPLLHPRFWDCCKLMLDNGIVIRHISSNLSLKINVDDFLAHPIQYIVANLGGVTKKVHEKCMRNSHFELVISNLRDLWAAKIPVHVKINPTKLNMHQLDKLPDLVRHLGGKQEYIIPYTTYFPYPDHCTEEEKKFFLENVYDPDRQEFFRFYNLDDSIFQKQKICSPDYMVDTVFVNGNYGICCHDNYEQSITGNIFDSSLEEIRSSDLFKSTYYKGLKRQLENCKYCA